MPKKKTPAKNPSKKSSQSVPLSRGNAAASSGAAKGLIGRIIRRKISKKMNKKKPNKWLRTGLLVGGGMLLLGGLAALIFVVTVIGDIPDIPTRLENVESTIIYDREGNVLYTIHGEENRKEIPLSEIPKHVVDATIAIEDDQFFDHYGFDVGGIVKGFLAEYMGIGRRRGGSTITQQLVKNTVLTSERTLTRKIKELLISIQFERAYSKNEILSMYLNTIPYGSNAYGIEMAARIYFDKHAPDLTLAEAAILASLPQAPSRYNPYGNGKEALMGSFDDEGNYVPGRKDVVLKRMEDLDYITSEERQEAFEEATEIEFKKYRENIKYPHFVLYVKELLENKFGKEAVETGGLHVYTTIDPAIQDKAEEIITKQMESYPTRYDATNAAALTVDLERGQILAMVGSSDYFNEDIDGNVNVVFRQRLAGSSFKPIVYAAGFAKGFSPASVFYDVETDFGNDYVPQNYDGEFRGPVSARTSLAHSLNVPAVKMAFLAGADNIVNLAKKMGVSDLIDGDQYGTSIGLGTGEATLYQMVTAFSVFAKGGQKIAFTPFLRIETSNGKVIETNEEREPKSKEVLDPQIAYTVNHVLSDESARPAGWGKLQIPNHINAAKTGTSNKRIREGKGEGSIKPLDNWTIGYTTRVATGVWVGNNDATPLSHKAAGLSTAGPIWNAIMVEATKKHDLEEFDKPKGINWKRISKHSGLLPSEHTPDDDIMPELFTSFNEPEEVDQTFLMIEIDEVSQKLPTEFTPEESIVSALVANFRSLNPTDPNWEEPVQEWAEEFIETYPTDTILLSEIPTESDDVHTPEAEENKPIIAVVSPAEDTFMPLGMVEIQVDIDAPHGVERVDYFLNQKKIVSSDEYPYTGKFRITRRAKKRHRVGVTVTDKLGYQSTDVVHLRLSEEEDKQPPKSQISYPEEGAIFPPNTTLTIQTESFDNISIDNVTFYLDDRLLGKVKRPPYQYTTQLPVEYAPHTITIIAKDVGGNTARDDVTIRIEEDTDTKSKTEFLFPKSGSTLSQGKPIDFFFQLSKVDQRSATKLDVIAIDTVTETETVIYSSRNDDEDTSNSANFGFAWVPVSKGSYDFVIETTNKSDKTKRSGKLRLKIE